MEDNNRIRKQVYELTAHDFQRHPLWEFCSDEEDVEGQDEATVRPSGDEEVPGFSPGAYVLAAIFRLAEGSEYPGYLYSGELNDFGCIQPVLLLDDGQLSFWRGIAPFDLESTYRRIGKKADEVFPVHVTGLIRENDETVKFTIEGFGVLNEDFEPRILR